MIIPGCKKNNKFVSTLTWKIRENIAYPHNNFWKGSSLKSDSRIPFSAQRGFHCSFKLDFARVRIRQIFHKVFSSLFIPFFRDDYMLFVEIGTRGRIHSSYFLYSLRFRREIRTPKHLPMNPVKRGSHQLHTSIRQVIRVFTQLGLGIVVSTSSSSIISPVSFSSFNPADFKRASTELSRAVVG